MKKLLCLTSILLLVCFFTLVACDESYTSANDKDDIGSITQSISNSTTSTTKSSTTKASTTKPSTTSTAPRETTIETVYYTATGTKYHSRKTCAGLSNANNIYSTDLQSAKSNNLGPCSKCY